MSAEPWVYHDGDLELRGELVRPIAPFNGAAILVVHEADGIGGNVREHAARLANLGYIVAAADMHGRGRVLQGADMAEALETFRADPDLLRRRVRAALDAMKRIDGVAPDRIAAIGFCFGGMTVLELARSGAPVRAVASFHGLLTTAAPAQPGVLQAKILVATGAKDPLVPASDIATFQQEMSQVDADWHLLVHGRALHSFTNHAVDKMDDPRMAYDGTAHRLSWDALTFFLEDALHANART